MKSSQEDDMAWKSVILSRLKARKEREQKPFEDLVMFCSKLFEVVDSLRNDNLVLKMQLQCNPTTGSLPDQQSKLLQLQEELTQLHKSRGENAQQIVVLRNTLEDKEKEILSWKSRLDSAHKQLQESQKLISTLKASLQELETTKQSLSDEHTAIQMAFVSLESKHLSKEKEFATLLERYIALKASQAEKMNQENEAAFEAKRAAQAKAIASAIKDMPDVDVDGASHAASDVVMIGSSCIPVRKVLDFEAHEAEVNAIKFLADHSSVTLLTGGGDRRVKAWDVSLSNGRATLKTFFSGSNAAITSIDTSDGHDSLILASSNDFASRVWSTDGKLKRTLTGHSNKVMAAKFLSGGNKVVSGSHDRTLKIWDLNRHSCIRTLFAGSSCNDLIVASSESTVVSGHFDKRIRFWETRTESSTCNEILLEGRITSLAIHGNNLLTCVRDDSLKQLDLRMNSVVRTFVAENFKVGCDWSRACFSGDGEYVACGSSDGIVFVWNLLSGKVESILKDASHSGHNVIACSWSINTSSGRNSCFVSGDRAKKVVVWTD